MLSTLLEKVMFWIIVALGTSLIGLSFAYKIEHNAVVTLTEQVIGYKTAEASYKASIANANASITAYQAEAKKREADAAAALAAAKAQITKHETLAVKVMTYKPATTDTCKASNDLFNEYLNERNK